MGPNEAWIVPEMKALTLLQVRPAALAPLERWGIDPWQHPEARLDALSVSARVPWPEFAAVLASLPATAGSGLESASIPELLDYLVADHREILGGLVPAVRTALQRLSALPDGAGAGLDEAWDSLTSGLAAHMREEESFLFPRLLHYAHCLRTRGRHPDFNGGSVNVYIAIRLLGNEHLQMDALRRFLYGRDALASGQEQGSAELTRVLRMLTDFQERLERHNHVEEAILYPKARDLEKSLYDAAIAGAGAAPADARSLAK